MVVSTYRIYIQCICPNLCCYTSRAFIYRWSLVAYNKNYLRLIPCPLAIPSTAICHLLHIALWTLPLHLICTSNTLPSPVSKDRWKWAIADTTTHIPGADTLRELSLKFKKKQQIKALKSIHPTANEDFSQSAWCTEKTVCGYRALNLYRSWIVFFQAPVFPWRHGRIYHFM